VVRGKAEEIAMAKGSNQKLFGGKESKKEENAEKMAVKSGKMSKAQYAKAEKVEEGKMPKGKKK
jgi:hypothetical protein